MQIKETIASFNFIDIYFLKTTDDIRIVNIFFLAKRKAKNHCPKRGVDSEETSLIAYTYRHTTLHGENNKKEKEKLNNKRLMWPT